MNGWGPILGSVAVAFLGLFGTWLVQRNQKKANKTTDTQSLIDQLQEERAAEQTKFERALARLDERQDRTEKRLENTEGMFRIASDYILSLRHHIAAGLPPPPPPFPAEMTRGMPNDR